MLAFLVYLINLLRIKFILFKRRHSKRFNLFTLHNHLSEHQKLGLLANESDWFNSTPNLDRPENVSIIASNVHNKFGLQLNLKWRPNSKHQLTTLVSELSIEHDGNIFDFHELSTYKPSTSSLQVDKITQFGSNGSSLKLFVLDPYRKYRIVFRGYMKRRSGKSSFFVKLNLIAHMTSKVFDFREEIDEKHLAKQLNSQGNKLSVEKLLNELLLQDRHEHCMRLVGDFIIGSGQEKVKEKVFLWGIHSKHFLNGSKSNKNTRRILAHFSNGRAFHLASIQSNKDKSSAKYIVGFFCSKLGPTIDPVSHCDKQLDWTQVDPDTKSLKFKICNDSAEFFVKIDSKSEQSNFLDAKLNDVEGWATILLDDATDSQQELQKVESSLAAYLEDLATNRFVDPKLSEDKLNCGKPLAISINVEECRYSSVVGAKASSLAQLKHHSKSSPVNYAVSDAVMLTRFAYESLQEANPNLRDEIKSLEARVGRGELDGLADFCNRIQTMIESDCIFPDSLKKEISNQLQTQLRISNLDSLDDRSFAVRSSSWGEDEDEMSAAGQLSTLLNVRGFEQLLVAVLKCFASKFSLQNVEYKRQHGMSLDLPMAVVVQEMVECESAGVAFSCEPTSGDQRRVAITANFGLGESVVSGQTDPDSITLQVSDDDELSIAEVKIGEKKVILTGDGQSIDEDRSKCCLSEEQMLRLGKVCLELAEYFGSPRDVEWGFKDNQLYLFQSRPVTGLDAYTETELLHEADMPSRAEVEFYTRVNICEVSPYAQTPLNLSLSFQIWTLIFDRLFSRIRKRVLRNFSAHYQPGFFRHKYLSFFGLRGRSFFNFERKPDEQIPVIARALEIAMFGHEVNNAELNSRALEAAEPDDNRCEDFKFNWRTLKYQLRTFQAIAENKKNLARLRRDIHSLRFADTRDGVPTLKGLLDQLRACYAQGDAACTTHIVCTLLSSKANASLLQLLSKYIQDPLELFQVFSKFLASVPNVLSAEIPRRIDRMGKIIANRGMEDVRRFVEMSTIDGLKYVSRDMRSELAVQFDQFMVKFNHRCYNEFEPAQPRWRETPEKIVEMLQANVRRYLSEKPQKDKDETSTTLDDLIDSLNVKFSFVDRLKLRWFVAVRSQKYVSARELTKDAAIEFHDIQRDAIMMLGRHLRQSNRIPDEDLVFYFFYHEIEPLVREAQPALVSQAIRRRRLIKKISERAWQFEEIIKGHQLIPLHLKPNSELDEKLANAPKLKGITASAGRAEGKVCLVTNYQEISKVESGDILVAYATDIAFSPIFPLLGGVITEVGGLISHGAVVAREYGLPSVISIENVTKILKHGERIILDADNAQIIRLEHESG